MNDMERRKFEDSFQEAFKDAEVSPAENVWTNIELDLEKAEGEKMRRRLIFFKTLAAASVTFAIVVAGIGYLTMSGIRTDNNLAQSDSKISTEQNVMPDAPLSDGSKSAHPDTVAAEALQQNSKVESIIAGRKETENPDPATSLNKRRSPDDASLNASDVAPFGKHKDDAEHGQNIAANNSSPSDERSSLSSLPSNLPHNGSRNAISIVDKNEKVNEITSLSNDVALTADRNISIQNSNAQERKLPALYSPVQPTLTLPASNADPGLLLLAKIAEEEQQYARADKKERTKQSEKLWTSVGFAAGGFSANNPSVSSPSNSVYAMRSSNTASKQSKASGMAYSVGVSLGARISNRWVVQGGLNYMTQMSDYTANSVVVVDNNFASPKAESLNAFSPQLADASQAKVAMTYPYNVNNSVQSVSFPVQAGYLVVNKKFGVQLNAGLATDLFLQNTITPDGGGLSKTTQGRGEDSPYRSVNFSGLMGTEFSYRLGDRYRVALNPGLRYPFNSVYKENTGVNANPLTFDVGLRFRYIFQ